MVGVSLRDTEHWTAPDFTNFLCVLHILLYSWLTFLGGTGLVAHAPEAVLVVDGWEAAGTKGLWDLGSEYPCERSALTPSLLLSAPCRSPPRVFCWANVTTCGALSPALADQAQGKAGGSQDGYYWLFTEKPKQ